jgi:hypothetical protein
MTESAITGFGGNYAENRQNRVGSGWIRNYGIIPQLAAALLLAACQTAEPGVEIRTVRVPVPQPCLPAEAIPPEPPQVGALLTGSASHDLTIVAESALLLRAWGQEMAAALRACAG